VREVIDAAYSAFYSFSHRHRPLTGSPESSLGEVNRDLAHGVEGEPLAEPGAGTAPQAARQAYDLLLTLSHGEG
jgi:hypothetical protein